MSEDVKKSEIVDTQEDKANQKSDKDENFERLRKKVEALENENYRSKETIEKQNQLLERFQSAFSQPQDEEEDLERLDPDDYISKRQLSKWEKKILAEAEKLAEKKYYQNFEERLRSRYQDYDDVVTAENARELENQDPEYAQLLAEVKDDYKRREMAYKRIKRLQKERSSAQEKAEQNKNKNYYYAPLGAGNTPPADIINFDVKDSNARREAYQKLKAAQKRGL